MAKLPWKPWHEVVKLRDDLKSGELPLHMFAADLYEVLMQNGKRPIYEKPENFFALTFPTHNLRALVRDVVLRLAGKNDKAVRQLELTYGGGKTHTLITLRHLAHDPAALPDLPAVAEFEQAIGMKPPKARVAGLCFDKLDVETGMDVRSPDGNVRRLKQPWSVLAYQIAGDDGLKLLHADKKAEERESAPAENVLTELLELPVKQGMGVLILIDEVLMYVREKVALTPEYRARMVNFFQYLTQAATKVDRCCIVASLLASDPKKNDAFGNELKSELYDIFQRQREEAVEPVVKEDVAEVLRRRFFTTESIKTPGDFKQHVIAAIKGIADLDEQTAKQGVATEERYLKSFPFHPELTEVFYSKWTQLDGFQRTRGVLRTFALALREAEKWDTSPLVGPAAFLGAPGKAGLSEAVGELVTVADTGGGDGGRRQAWTGILVGELTQAQSIQVESVGLKFREIEEAVIATFLHSQPIGQSAKTRELMLLLGPTRPFKIDLEKGLMRWAQTSHWLDDRLAPGGNDLPAQWRLGNRPNLNQMHSKAASDISDDVARARLIDEIGKTKALTAGASAAGVRVHTLPAKPKEIDDDGIFRYAVLGPSASSESGKPSPEAKRFLDETTGPEKPRVFRNSALLLCPSKDGLEVAMARVRELMAWDVVQKDLKEQEKEGNIDASRMATLSMNIDKAKGRVPEAVKQAYCIVVTVNEKDDVHAFKITVTDDPIFQTIKEDQRSRIQDTAVTAEALLPDGPYSLWKEGETSRRVKDLAGAFAQMPHLPKMLKAQAISDTLVEGCVQGAFVLRLMRPDRTFRTWWRSRPDEAALGDPALELVLPKAAELTDIEPELLRQGALPSLWTGEQISVADVASYFSGTKIVQVPRDGYDEPVQIPKATRAAIEKAVSEAVEASIVWLTSGPASLLGEPIPAGILTDAACLLPPPAAITAAEILPENLPTAWQAGEAAPLSIATSLSQKAGRTLPWKTVRDVIGGAIAARFVSVGSGVWPCDLAGAGAVRLKVVAGSAGGGGGGGAGGDGRKPNVLAASADFEPAEIQDLSDHMARLLEIRAKANVPIKFHVRVELGDGTKPLDKKVLAEFNQELGSLKDGFSLQ
ncbi:MAG: ATP-binding protein [Planctomycetes bacterium]|nr:ATP-binding protein [Planctomycetota bacterium]